MITLHIVKTVMIINHLVMQIVIVQMDKLVVEHIAVHHVVNNVKVLFLNFAVLFSKY